MVRLLLRWKNALLRMLTLSKISDQIEDSKILSAKVLINQTALKGILAEIKDAEFKVFSQYGEDGILQYLIRITGVPEELSTFVEFGVENYTESNTRFLVKNNNWRGLVIDGNLKNIEYCKADDIYWRHDLTAINAFINADNINQIILDAGFTGNIGLLSIDIDGNDYWIWERINVINPIIVVCEYNSVFGAKSAVTVPYNSNFIRKSAHYSNLYFGCSLKALELIGKAKGYALVGTTSVGNNAFFVRYDRLNELKELTTEKAYHQSYFRESRGVNGNLTYLSGRLRLKEIMELPLYDVMTKKNIFVKDIMYDT